MIFTKKNINLIFNARKRNVLLTNLNFELVYHCFISANNVVLGFSK